MPNIGSRRRFISAVFKIHLIAIYWFVDQSSERRAKSITNSGFWTSLIMTLIASRLLRRFQKSPGCHACWAHGISQRACLQRGGEDKGDTGPVIDTCKNWNWYTMIYMWNMLSSPCILCKKWWSKKCHVGLERDRTDSGCCSCSLSVCKPRYYVLTNSMKTRCQWVRTCSKLNAFRRDLTCHKNLYSV